MGAAQVVDGVAWRVRGRAGGVAVRGGRVGIRRWLLALVCGWLTGAGTLVAQPATAPPGQPERLRVVAIGHYPPYLFTGLDGKLEGYEVDRWHLFEAHTGIKVELFPASWNTASKELLDGQADVIDLIYRNARRDAQFDFTPPYAVLPSGIYVDRGKAGIRDLAMLRGVRVGAARGSICEHRLEAPGLANLRLYADAQDVAHAAASGYLDVFCMEQSQLRHHLNDYPGLDRFDRAFVLQSGEFRLAVRKGDAATLAIIERGMARITPAEQAALQQRWLARPPVRTPFPREAVYALLAVALLAASMVLWVWLLRRSVAARTRELAAGEAKLRALFDASPFAMWEKDVRGIYQDCNERVLGSLRLTREQLIGRTDAQLFPAALVAQVQAMDARTLRLGLRHVYTLAYDGGDGGQRLVEVVNTPLRDGKGKVYGLLGAGSDITERSRAESELRLAAVAFQTQEAMLVMDTGRRIQRVNRAFVQLTGYAAKEAVGQPSSLIRSRHHEAAFYRELWEQVERTGYWQGEYWVKVRQGQPRVVRMTVTVVRDDDGVASHYVAAMVDLTGEHEARASVDRMTFFDPLTDLPNRNFLHGRLQHLLEGEAAPGGALLLIDMDHFKRVNDLRGHAAGDRLLVQLAQRLRRLLDEDSLLCRFGGGSFALLRRCRHDDPADMEAPAARLAERVRQLLASPFELADGAMLTVTASIGWALLLPANDTPEMVLKQAELAMYEAKAAGRDQIRRYLPAMQTELEQHEALLQALRQALARDALELHLQAQEDRQGRVVGAEVLLRWTLPDGEAVSPKRFIPIAETSGLILPLGDWVLRRACEMLVAWAAQPALRELSLAVNVSARQFAQAGFVDGVRAVLATSGADPARLKLEITESAILDELEDAAGKLRCLRALGMRISLDDFGTGYSSLSYLSRLPLDQLKIDQSFVARLTEDASDAMVAQTIIGMGHGLGLEVIAEGVETATQRQFLLGHGCDVFQGYLIARPQPRAAFEAMLTGRHA